MKILSLVLKGLVRILPWVLRFLVWSVWQTLMFFTTWWHGLPTSMERVSEVWMDRLRRAGVIEDLDFILQPLLRVAAFIAFVAGWIVYSFVTVYLVLLIFN